MFYHNSMFGEYRPESIPESGVFKNGCLDLPPEKPRLQFGSQPSTKIMVGELPFFMDESSLPLKKTVDSTPYMHLHQNKQTTNKQPTNQTNKQTNNQPTNQTNKQPNKQTNNQPTKQTNKQTNNQPTNQPNKQTNKQPTKQTNKQTTNQPTSQTNKQTNKQPTNQTNKQTNKQPTKQTTNQPNKQTNKQTTNQPTSQTNKQTNKQTNNGWFCLISDRVSALGTSSSSTLMKVFFTSGIDPGIQWFHEWQQDSSKKNKGMKSWYGYTP